jgi:hypothetical protein
MIPTPPRKTLAALVLALAATPATAGEVLRLCTYNVLRLDHGTAEYTALVAMVRRVDPDVLCVQEIWNDAGDLAFVDDFAADIGLPFFAVAGPGGTASDPRVATFSRYPFCEVESWTAAELSGDSGANDLVRELLEVRLAVPSVCGPAAGVCCGNLVVINAHLKAGSNTDIDRFRRAVELRYRLVPLSALALSDCPGATVVVAGDLNEPGLLSAPPVVFSAVPPGAPGSYQLGQDVVLPFSYDPDALLAAAGGSGVSFELVDAAWEDAPSLKATFPSSGGRLDYLWISSGPAAGSLSTPVFAEPVSSSEVYHSAVDNGVDDGPFGQLARKYGSGPLAAGTAASASDHLPVFADLLLEACQGQRIGQGSPGQFGLRPLATHQGLPLAGSLAFVPRVEQARPGQLAFLFAGAPLWPTYGALPLPVDSVAPGLIPGAFAYSSGLVSLAPVSIHLVDAQGEAAFFVSLPAGLAGLPIAVQWLVTDPAAPGNCCALSDGQLYVL